MLNWAMNQRSPLNQYHLEVLRTSKGEFICPILQCDLVLRFQNLKAQSMASTVSIVSPVKVKFTIIKVRFNLEYTLMFVMSSFR
jgi:hypothetical protein